VTRGPTADGRAAPDGVAPGFAALAGARIRMFGAPAPSNCGGWPGDDETALVMYDTETVPVKGAPGAECVTVKDGKITYSRNVFDSAPIAAALQASS
jgi:hypothetical protein